MRLVTADDLLELPGFDAVADVRRAMLAEDPSARILVLTVSAEEAAALGPLPRVSESRNGRFQRVPKPPPLTPRERDILRLLAQGLENSAIATELSISSATVKTHVAHLLEKLGLANRVQAAVFAVRHGIV
jgi:DNA-binding CsgD family transcriptional regulator